MYLGAVDLRSTGKREPGISPGRSRHCKQGASLFKPLGKIPGKVRRSDDCESGNLPKYEAFLTFRWKRGA